MPHSAAHTHPSRSRSLITEAIGPLCIENGCSAPVKDIPFAGFDMFSHWIADEVHRGGRVAAFFILPESALPGEGSGTAWAGVERRCAERRGKDAAHGGAPRAEAWAGTERREAERRCAERRGAETPGVKERGSEASGTAASGLEAAAAEEETRVFRLVAVLAADACGKIFLAGTRVGERYPSLTPRIPSLHLFERELHEKHGITPEGHPWLKPVRFERSGGPEAGEADFFTVTGDEVHEVAVGPIHAGIIECGHFRFQCLGEVVMHLEISLGYHHRGVERLILQGHNARTLGLMETLCGDSTIAHAWAYCSNMETLSAAPAPPRAQLLRALALELERLANHTGDLGAIAGDVGFLPTLSFCGRLRGDWLNMSAELCGNRFGRGLVCPGGTRFDADDALLKLLAQRLEATHRDVRGAVRLLWDSPSVMARLTGIGRVTKTDAATLGMVGLAARASGIARDARRFHPLPFLPAPPEPAVSTFGDVLARAKVRAEEIDVSAACCKRLLDKFLREGGSATRCAQPKRPVPGRVAVTLVEGWRGEICHVAVTGNMGELVAYQVVDPSFHNWMGLALALRGQQISDFPLCNKSFNLSYCGHDL